MNRRLLICAFEAHAGKSVTSLDYNRNISDYNLNVIAAGDNENNFEFRGSEYGDRCVLYVQMVDLLSREINRANRV